MLLTLGLLAATVVGGCEDVVQVELNSTEPKLVIEGYLSEDIGRSLFIISRTTNFYDPSVVVQVSGAIVIIVDDLGVTDTLVELREGSGEYSFRSHFYASPGHTYHADVTVEAMTYTATTTMPPTTKIDSLRFEYQAGGGLGTEEKEGYRLHVYFQDRPDESDYVRFRLQRLIGYREYNYYEYYLYDGRFSDGNTIDYDYFLNVFQPGDTVGVELISMEKAMYYYFLTLSEVAATEEGNFLDVTPANPNTNWSGGALGYFGAFNSDFESAQVE